MPFPSVHGQEFLLFESFSGPASYPGFSTSAAHSTVASSVSNVEKNERSASICQTISLVKEVKVKPNSLSSKVGMHEGSLIQRPVSRKFQIVFELWCSLFRLRTPKRR